MNKAELYLVSNLLGTATGTCASKNRVPLVSKGSNAHKAALQLAQHGLVIVRPWKDESMPGLFKVESAYAVFEKEGFEAIKKSHQ